MKVEVFADQMLVHGLVSGTRRLTDLVNDPEHFLVLRDSRVWPYRPDSPPGLEHHFRGLVNKASIVFLTEHSAPSEASDDVRGGMRVPKVQQRILLYTRQFALNAAIRLAMAAAL